MSRTFHQGKKCQHLTCQEPWHLCQHLTCQQLTCQELFINDQNDMEKELCDKDVTFLRSNHYHRRARPLSTTWIKRSVMAVWPVTLPKQIYSIKKSVNIHPPPMQCSENSRINKLEMFLLEKRPTILSASGLLIKTLQQFRESSRRKAW